MKKRDVIITASPDGIFPLSKKAGREMKTLFMFVWEDVYYDYTFTVPNDIPDQICKLIGCGYLFFLMDWSNEVEYNIYSVVGATTPEGDPFLMWTQIGDVNVNVTPTHVELEMYPVDGPKKYMKIEKDVFEMIRTHVQVHSQEES